MKIYYNELDVYPEPEIRPDGEFEIDVTEEEKSFIVEAYTKWKNARKIFFRHKRKFRK